MPAAVSVVVRSGGPRPIAPPPESFLANTVLRPSVVELAHPAAAANAVTAATFFGTVGAAVAMVSTRRRAGARGRNARLATRAVKNPVQLRDSDELEKYKIAFAAESAEEWQSGRVVGLERGDATTVLSVEVEASREHVPLVNAYRVPGQRLHLRFASDGADAILPVASPPPPHAANKQQLWQLKGDIFAGETKKAVQTISSKVVVDALYTGEDVPVDEGDEVQVGPFVGDGVNLRPVLGLFRARALAIFCDGTLEALCMLRAAVEATDCASELQLAERHSAIFCAPLAPGLPQSLRAWLDTAKMRFGCAESFLGADPLVEWDEVAAPFLRHVLRSGANCGAVVLGDPAFRTGILSRLTAAGIPPDLISTSADAARLSHVLEPEQV